MLLGSVVLSITYVLVSARRLRFVRLDRPAGALVGAVLAVAVGAIRPEDAAKAVDHTTIVLLFAPDRAARDVEAAGPDARLGAARDVVDLRGKPDLDRIGGQRDRGGEGERGRGLRFGEYFKVGAPIALVTTLVGAIVLVLPRL